MTHGVSTTVQINVQVPYVWTDGTWTWVDDKEHSPAGQEQVRSEADLRRVMLRYGSAVAQMMTRQGPDQFRLLGRMCRSLAMYAFTWDNQRRRYIPEDEPWCAWVPSPHED